MKKVFALKIERKIVANEDGSDVLDSIVCSYEHDIEISNTITLWAGKTLELYGVVYLLVSGGTVVDYYKEGFENIKVIIIK
jgi:hypothetical protein